MMKKAVLKKMARVAIKTLLYEVGVLTMFEDTPLNEEDVEYVVNEIRTQKRWKVEF